MFKCFEKVALGLTILFGYQKVSVRRNKSINTTKELRIAKAIKKTSIVQRSANRIQKIARDTIG